MAAVDYDEILKDSNPYKIYEELNKQVKNATDGQYCSEFENVEQDYRDKSVKLCKKVTNLLEFVYEKDKSKDFKDYCSHYKYWVYQEINKLFNEHSSKSDIDDVIKKFNKLQTVLFTKHKKRDCSYRFDYNTFEGLKYNIEEKYLYDYFKNYNTIKSSETCKKCNNSKYKEYLKFISDIYNNVKEDCCLYGTSVCDNYFLTCDDKFDPRKLLSALLSKGSVNCDGLSNITSNFDEEKLNSMVTDPKILNSITYGTCFNLNNHELTSSNAKYPHCSLLATSVTLNRSVPTDGNAGRALLDSGSPLDGVNLLTGDGQVGENSPQEAASQGEPRTKTRGGDSHSPEELKQEATAEEDAPDTFRWKFDGGGTLQCQTKSRGKNEEVLCEYMDVLIEGTFATHMKDTKSYKVKAGISWTEDDLKPAREIVRKRRSANESNILNNIFFRISTAVTLVMGIIFIFYLFFKFTPFGSRLRRHRKRKQRYRLDFADLSTRKRPRRFLKRTYRHSDRRRFNVVNIEDELLSSNDLRNIN
ncbi:PIR protein [Plasmodium malariae]|uniref:PIR protein n=1 Tax=Plasmodium malariae TaxID=5858 RepID=A0A1D3JGX8_PLAMA|nr:PIR protein [Plasmodium malariae]SBT85525.1 PIR protein [Plasmodium malariae]